MIDRPRAVVIGAGFAGLSAAVRLVDAGWHVTVLERAPRAGGRATAFTDRVTGDRVDNGQHVLFGCYRETYAFLRRLGTDGLAPLQPRLSLVMARADAARFTLTCPNLTPPWHLIAGVMRWRALGVRDRLAAARIGAVIRRARRDGAAAVAADVPAEWTVTRWLDAHGQTAGIREWLWHPLTFAALNQPPEIAAAAPFVRVVAELFGPRVEDAAVGLARVPLDELYVPPAIQIIERAGGVVRLKTEPRLRAENGRVVVIDVDGGLIDADAVISAVPWHAFGDLWHDGVPEPITPVAAAAASTTSSPIVTVNLWIDGDVVPGPFVGFAGGPMHWAFDKRQVLGGRARHVSLVSSGATELVEQDNDAIAAAAVAQLTAALPAIRDRRVLRALVVREPRATFSLAPGSPPRPNTTSAIAGLYLAGDWTDTGLPATIEGAVLSGHRAADAAIRTEASTDGPSGPPVAPEACSRKP